MPIQQINIDEMKLHRDYIYDTIMFIANRATGLPCYVERENLNRPDSTYISMIIEAMNPLGYYHSSSIGTPEGETTEHQQRYIHYQTSLTINTWKQDANAYLMAIQAAMKDQSAINYMRDRNVGWLSESTILNNSTVLDEAWEERATILITLNSYVGNVDPEEFDYINSVDITGNVYVCGQPTEDEPVSDDPNIITEVEVVSDDCIDTFLKANDDNSTVEIGSSILIDVAANDIIYDTLDLTTITITEQPSNGTIINNLDGTLTYNNDGTGSGTDTFKYTINNNQGVTSNEATVTVNLEVPPLVPTDLVVHSQDDLSSYQGTSNTPDQDVTLTLFPDGISIDEDNNIYASLSDAGNTYRVQKYQGFTGTEDTSYNFVETSLTGFNTQDVKVAVSGSNIVIGYTTSTGSPSVYDFNVELRDLATFNLISSFTIAGFTGSVSNINGDITIDQNGNLVVQSVTLQKIIQFNGITDTVIGELTTTKNYKGITFDKDNNMVLIRSDALVRVYQGQDFTVPTFGTKVNEFTVPFTGGNLPNSGSLSYLYS